VKEKKVLFIVPHYIQPEYKGKKRSKGVAGYHRIFSYEKLGFESLDE
jgi:hypothetical protein